MTTNKKHLAELKEKRDKAVAAYNAYHKLFNEEHKIKQGDIVEEIIKLHKKGKTNAEIVEMGYNKNYVNQQVSFFRKGKRVARTAAARFLAPKKAKA